MIRAKKNPPKRKKDDDKDDDDKKDSSPPKSKKAQEKEKRQNKMSKMSKVTKKNKVQEKKNLAKDGQKAKVIREAVAQLDTAATSSSTSKLLNKAPTRTPRRRGRAAPVEALVPTAVITHPLSIVLQPSQIASIMSDLTVVEWNHLRTALVNVGVDTSMLPHAL